MTKRELITALESYDDEQYVGIQLYSGQYPEGSQVIIQEVRSFSPWHAGMPELIGLVAHAENTIPADRDSHSD